MKTFSKTVREYMWSRAQYTCEGKAMRGCLLVQGLSLHHIIANTKVNNALYGQKLQSSWNAVLLCAHCHKEYKHYYKDFRKELIYVY